MKHFIQVYFYFFFFYILYRSRTSSSISYGSACSHSPVCPASPVPHNNNNNNNSSHHHNHPQPNNSHGSSSCIAPVAPPGPPYRVTVLGCGGVGKRALTQQFTTSQYLGGGDSPFSHGELIAYRSNK